MRTKHFCPSDDYTCPYLTIDGECTLDDPMADCDDYYYYNGDDDDEY